MKKILKNNEQTSNYLDTLPKIYIVGCWAKYGIWDYPFTGKYVQDKNGISIPLVYDYDDCNGTCDNYFLRRLDEVTTGEIIIWTQNKNTAMRIVELLNKEIDKK